MIIIFLLCLFKLVFCLTETDVTFFVPLNVAIKMEIVQLQIMTIHQAVHRSKGWQQEIKTNFKSATETMLLNFALIRTSKQ